jgi:uncharacterized OB-fold protein
MTAPVRDGLFATDPPALLASRCGDCGALRFPAAALCATCQSEHVETVALAPEGELYTYTVVHAPPPGYRGETPYAVGVVELPDGLRVTATILGDALAVGDRVRFELHPVGDVLSYAYRRT